MSCAGIGDNGQYFVHVQGSSAVYVDSNQPAGLQQVLQHGCAGSMPNLTAYQHTANSGYQYAPSGRSTSFSTSIQRASMPGTFVPQQQQPQPVVGMQSTGVSFGVGMGDVILVTSPCAAGMQPTQQQQHVLLQPAGPLQATHLGNPGMSSGMPGGLQAVLGVGEGAASEQQYKLPLLAQLQAQITQQQQELQQELQYQHQAAGVPQITSGTYGPSATARGGVTAVAARLSAPGCMGAAHDDVRLGRDQARVLIARASAAGHIPVAANHSEHLFLAPNSVLQPQQLQQQQLMMQQQQQQQPFVQQQTIMLQQAMVQQQQDVMSPCAFNNTPTALAALPPGLLAELVGVDAAASVISWHWSASSKGPGISNSCSSSAGCHPTANTTPRAAEGITSSGHFVSSNTPRANSSMPGYTDVSSVALHQQLQLATDQLANLHISGTTCSAGPLSGPLLHSSGSKGWDWASVGELLRTDSSASRSSVRRADSGLVSETSIGSNIWGDGGGCHVAGSAVTTQALALAPCTTSGPLSQGTSVCPQAVQRTSSSDSSCASHASDCNVALRAGTGVQPRLAHSSSGGPDSGSNATVQILPGAVAGAVAAAEVAAAAAEAAKGLPAAAPRSCITRQSSAPSAAPGASVDTLLRDCAPKWAKAGWNPRSVVAAAPAAAARGTGAFVRRSSPGTAPSASSSAADSKPVVSAPSKKGTGAFIPPAVRAAVAAASGLGAK